MSAKLFFLLLTLTIVGGAVGIDRNQRRPRQLDLVDDELTSDQVLKNLKPKFVDPRLINNAYLPPVRGTVPPTIIIATEPARREETNSIGSDSKPINFLSPPLIGVERSKEQSSRNNIVLASQNRLPPVSKINTESKTPQNKFSFASASEASATSIGYLPPQPEYSPAAQTLQSQSVPVPPKEDDHHHHHHHHHHHDENYDICSDAFHSFLCTPLKARKRITGAFPERLRGQASFNEYRRVLPDRSPASSNQFVSESLSPFENEYLPPINTQSPNYIASTNFIRTTTLIPKTTQTPRNVVTTTLFPRTTQTPRTQVTTTYAPRTTQTPKSITTTTTQNAGFIQLTPETSNVNDRIYLPPLPQEKNYFYRDFKASSTINNEFRAQTTFPSPLPSANLEDATFNTFRSADTNKIVPMFLPASKALYQPSGTTLSTTRFNDLKVTREPPSTSFQPPLESSTKLKAPSSTSDTYSPSTTTNNFHHVSSKVNSASTTLLPPSPPKAGKLQNWTLNPPQPVTSTFSTVSSQTTAKLESESSTSNELNSFKTPLQKSSSVLSNTVKSYFEDSSNRSFQPTTLVSTRLTSGHRDNNYPSSEETVKPEFDIISTTISPKQKPADLSRVKVSQSQNSLSNAILPPLRDEQATSAILSSQQPYFEEKKNCDDSIGNNLCANVTSKKTETKTVEPNLNELKLIPASSNQISSAKENSLLTIPQNQISAGESLVSSATSESKGYNYPKPEKSFPLPSTSEATVTTTASTSVSPTSLETSEAKTFTGYSYPQPEQTFPLPSEVIETADSGYIYDKPEKELPLPSEQKVVTENSEMSSSTFLPPITTLGSSTSTPQLPSSTSVASTSLPQKNKEGYFYPKPQQSLKLPQREGYSYEKPENPLELPIEKTNYRPLFSEKASSPSAVKDLGSAVFIPVNKLEKRSDSTAALRFGERLRRLVRGTTPL